MENKEKLKISEYFREVKLTKMYEPYFCSVEEAISIVIIGTFCGFRNLKQIQQWANHDKTKEILREKFRIKNIPCYYWLTCLLKIIEAKSMNECFSMWVESLLPENMQGMTVSFDGKTICSTANMECYENPLHIVSAQIAELGLTFGQESVEGKSNEIPATQRLIKMLKIKGCVVVADALNCQKVTAKAIIEQGADYLLTVKDNHQNLKQDIKDFIQDKQLRTTMETATTTEKNRERIEKRTAFVSSDIDWLKPQNDWACLCCIGAINTRFTSKKGTSNEWHYYISSKKLTPEELLKHARAEWSVEAMHWLLDVHFCEDNCRVQSDNVQKVLNMIRKIVINSMRIFRDKTSSNRPFSNIMLDCLIDPTFILDICNYQN